MSVPGIPTPDGVASKDFSPDEELSTELANRRQKLFALVMVGISAAIFLAAAPFAKTPLAQVPAFIPVYESALVICDVITAILLFGQFNFQRSGRLFALATGYLFTAFMTVAHALTFPGVFAPTGLLGAGPQSTAWMYAFWHSGFPLVVLVYALVGDKPLRVVAGLRMDRTALAVISSVAAVLAVVCVFTLVATAHDSPLPPIMRGSQMAPAGQLILSVPWVLTMLALVALWRRRKRTVLDLWLLVVMCAWLFDIALSAILNAGRYDVGWYGGRIYGLLAATFVLAVLLIENGKHYARLKVSNEQLGLARNEADRANQAKSDFLSSMSHELRTPLNAILGFGQIMASDDLPSTPAQKKEFSGHIVKAGRHLLTLINEILDLAHVESGKVRLSMEPVSLAELLVDCQTIMDPLANQHGIRLVFPRSGSFHVDADRTRLKQVLLNLLSNAIKYNRDGGSVLVNATREVSGRIHISIQDTGMGLRADQMQALFQPFNRLGQESSKETGTGLGLVVTKRLTELMGGEIGVTSTVGGGTAFWIELKPAAPLAVVAGASHIASGAATVGGGADHRTVRTLLYIEDNPANLRLVEELMRFRPEMRLLTAADGSLGVAIARSHQPDIVLLDLNLPGLGGSDVLQMLRHDRSTAHIPVIALTANALPRDIARGVAAGFFRYLTKPVNIDELDEAIDSGLRLQPIEGQTRKQA